MGNGGYRGIANEPPFGYWADTVEEEAELAQAQRARGICSEPDCEQPIMGYCATCDAEGPFKAPKLCPAHLLRHLAAVLPAKHYPMVLAEV